MPLMRYRERKIWESYSAAADELSPVVDISKSEFVGVYVKVSGATTISILANFLGVSILLDEYSFTTAGSQFWILWATPYKEISVSTTDAVTIDFFVTEKT